MENNVFKTGAVMDLVANAEVVNEQVENLQDASNAQKVTSHAYKYLGKTNTIVREFVKIGRNDECPCGSGKKFKNCHGKDLK
jgi:preprotein translocase subunit SecA